MAKRPESSGGPVQAASATDALLERALLALQSQRPVEAERIVNEVLAAKARHPRALSLLGYALLMQARTQEAVAVLEDARRSSNDPEVETQLAIALRKSGRVDDALSVLMRAVKRRPAFPAAFHELGYLLYMLKRHDEAIDVLERGLAAVPNAADLSSQLGYVLLARNERANAQKAFARALAIAPGHADALSGLGRALIESGDFARAAEVYQHILALTPRNAEASIKLGQCLLELDQPEAASGCFRAAIRGGPKFYGHVLAVMVRSGHGRFWLRPSAAARFIRGEKP